LIVTEKEGREGEKGGGKWKEKAVCERGIWRRFRGGCGSGNNTKC